MGYNESESVGWYALMYAILLDTSSKQAMQYFGCCPDERSYKWNRVVKSDYVLWTARQRPELSTDEIAQEVGCSTSLVETVIARARKRIKYDAKLLDDIELQILEMNRDNPGCRYSTIASRLLISRNMVRSTIFRHLPLGNVTE